MCMIVSFRGGKGGGRWEETYQKLYERAESYLLLLSYVSISACTKVVFVEKAAYSFI